MIELTFADVLRVHNLSAALREDPHGSTEVATVVGPENNRRSVTVTGAGLKVDPETPLIPAPEA